MKASDLWQLLGDAVDESKMGLQAAFEAFAPHFALSIPSAPETRGNWATLATAQEETTELAFKFEQPIQVVGYIVTVTPVVYAAFDGAGLRQPSVDDLLIKYSVDNEYYPTQASENAQIGVFPINQYCDLAAYDIRKERQFNQILKNRRPEVRVTFRSKYATPGASNIPHPILIGFNFIYRRLPPLP